MTAELRQALAIYAGITDESAVTVRTRQLYAAAIRRTHPDNRASGNVEAFREVQAIREQLEKAGAW